MKTITDSWRELLFTDLLHSVRLRSSVYFQPRLRAPWGFSLAGRGTAFHIVVRGGCWLEVDKLSKPVRLSAGDLVVLPRGDAHVVRDAPGTRHSDLFDLLKRYPPNDRGEFRVDGIGPVTRLICGGMQFENANTEPLLAVLPPLIHVRGRGRRTPQWLRATIMHLDAELGSPRPGATAVVTRLSDILFVQAVREYFDGNVDMAEFGWMAAIRDPQIGPAVALLHKEPDKPWIVALLAERVGLSRSALAAKFRVLVGEPPLRYLTRLRIHAAMERLRSGDEKMNAIASSVGYESITAFNRAFKQHLGVTPGNYRRGYLLDISGRAGERETNSH